MCALSGANGLNSLEVSCRYVQQNMSEIQFMNYVQEKISEQLVQLQ